MWTKQHAAVALREVVVLAGVRADEYARHSLALGAQRTRQQGVRETLQREGQCSSDVQKAYVRSHGKMPAG